MNNLATIGISAFGHDSAASLIHCETGKIQLAISEERLSGIKHTGRLPIRALQQCIATAKQHKLAISRFAINYDEREFILGTLARELKALISPPSVESFVGTALQILPYCDYFSPNTFSYELLHPIIQDSARDQEHYHLAVDRVHWYFNWAVQHRDAASAIESFLGEKVARVRHHLAHAAAAYCYSPFENALAVIFDGQGESESITAFDCDLGGLTPRLSVHWPNSLGFFFLSVVDHLGFELGDEYKVMGMAAYGKPTYYEDLMEALHVLPNGQLEILDCGAICRQPVSGLRGHFFCGVNQAFFEKLPVRHPGDPLTQQHFNLAASAQAALETKTAEIVSALLPRQAPCNLVLGGGVALNGLVNNRLRHLPGVADFYAFPASGDDGTAVGAALCAGQVLKRQNKSDLPLPFWGPQYSNEVIEKTLKEENARYHELGGDYAAMVATNLANGFTFGLFTGESEFGPRALGHRSILASPCKKGMKDVLNSKIKGRENFRPFGAICLIEEAPEWFDLDTISPYMLLIVEGLPNTQALAPEALHRDGTCRLQTISRNSHEPIARILAAFYKLTGVPILINTSFNIGGEPIVETPLDALRTFRQSNLDYLILQNYLVCREENYASSRLSTEEFIERRMAAAIADEPVMRFDTGKFYFNGIAGR